jgi:hypothetical protein
VEAAPITGSLACTTQHIAVWNHLSGSRYAGKILQLARDIASQPQLRLRMLVIGDISEMLWHTGVVDGVPAIRSDAKVLLDDRQLLELSGSAIVLTEEPEGTPATAPVIMLSDEFNAATWLADWVTSNPSGLAA